MLRPAFLIVLALVVCIGQAQQVEPHGPPASILSPTSPGTAHGTPSSVNSPVPANNGLFINPQRRLRSFGNPRIRHNRHDNNFVPVPIFIPSYPLADYTNGQPEQPTAEQSDSGDSSPDSASAADAEALREAYYRGAHDALAQAREDSRYGEHYLDSREKKQPPPPSAKEKAMPKEAPPQEEEPVESGPATVFVFKDGHRVETQNYAIQGQTLFDFSNNQLKKIKLADLDLDATKKANDDLGITVKFPPGTP